MSQVSNWSQSVQFTPSRIVYPKTEDEIRELISGGTKGPFRTVGTGHSFGPLIETEGTLLSLDQMQGLISLDEASGDVTLWGGTKLWKMNELLIDKKRSVENLGDIDRQSIAGALSTGTHGTGRALGTISTQARELTLVTGTGEILTCSEETSPDVFKAAQVSLGALGVITRARLKSFPAYRLKLVQKREKLDDFINRLEEVSRAHRHFEFFFFPYSPYTQTKYVNVTDEPALPHTLSDTLNEVVLENMAFKVLSEISRLLPFMTKTVAKTCGAAVSGRTKTKWAHDVFSTPRWVKFQEMEYSIPAEKMKDAITELSAMIERKNIRVHFPIECRFVKGDDIWLSPAYGRDSAYLAIHMYKGMEYRPYFEAAQSIFLNHGGRPHWGKMHFLTTRELRPLYPKWDEFQAVRERLDPKGIFLNSFLKKIFLR